MPIYGFECEACGHQFDRLQKLSDADPTHCPACQKETLRRQLTAPQFRLAGSGWYETDFKKEGDKKRNLAETGETKSSLGSEFKAEAKVETKSETKTESAPAAKVESKPAAVPSGSGST
ncbi:MAG: FmdB family zinc ribbon protein [Arenimonas sp.]